MAINKTSLFSVFRKISALLADRGFGKSHLLLSAYKYIYKNLEPSHVILTKVQGSQMYIDPADKSVSADILAKGYYDKAETELLKGMIREGMTVLDIGANIGYYTLIFSRLVGKNGKVIAVEAEPYNCSLIRKSIQANGYTNIELVQKALSDVSGKTIEFFVEKESFGSGSFALSNIGKEGDRMIVDTITIDDLLSGRKVDVIKMDVQGAESKVIEGAKRLLASRSSMKIITEFWPYGLENVGSSPLKFLTDLLSAGFAVCDIGDMGKTISAAELPGLIEKCKRAKGGRGFTTLLFERN